MSITEIAIKRPTLIVVIFTVLSIVGIICYQRLNYNLFPKFEMPVISVVTIYPGASPGVMETSVTKPLEDAVATLENLDKIASISQEGVSFITIQLTNDANVDIALQDAQRKINSVLSTLPDDAETPSLNKFSFDDLPILQFSASSKLSPMEFYQLMDNRIRPELSKISGMGQITLVGGKKRKIMVNVKRQRLEAYGISLSQIVNVIKAGNQEVPAGEVKGKTDQFDLRVEGEVKSLDQLANLVVLKGKDGGLVRLSEVAEVTDATEEVETLSRINYKSSIGVLIQKQTDANTVQVSEEVKKMLQDLQVEYKEIGLNFIVSSDTSTFTLAAAHSVLEDLLFAVILVALVMLVFLHSIRNAAIVMVAIPLSIVSTFIAMYIFNFSLNLMTLMALSLVIGILVDDSIVVLENIYRHLEMGSDQRTAALEGRNEIGFTALSITLVDVVVFGPLSLVGGLIGNILREFSIVVMVSTLMSLFVSFTVTPMLASRFSRILKFSNETLFGRFNNWFERKFEELKENYTTLLKWSLRHRLIVTTIIVVMLIASFALVPLGLIGSTFIAEGDRGEFVVTLELDQTSTLYHTNQITSEVEKIILKKPVVVKVFSTVGQSSTLGSNQPANNISQLTVIMTDKKERTITVDEFANEIKNEISQIPGIKVTSTPTGLTGSADDLPIQIIVRGVDLKNVMAYANEILSTIKKIPGISDPDLSVNEGNPELEVRLDRDKMAKLGLSVADVGGTLMTAFTGNTDIKYREADEEYDIKIVLDQFDRRNVDDVKRLTVINPSGQLITLSQFAVVQQSRGPSKLERNNRIPSVTVKSNVVGRPVGTVGDEIQAKVIGLKKPAGVNISYEGQLEQQAEAFTSLLIAFMIGIVFVYLIMVALYNSYTYPFVVLFSIPLAIIGALVALALTKETLNIFSILGMIMMMGLVAKNAILLVDFTNHMKEKGANTFDALIEAGRERIRPIFMTTLTMILGMMPIALASGAASEAKNGLAWVLIGGLTSSMFLTLIFVPIVYETIDAVIYKISKRFSKKADV